MQHLAVLGRGLGRERERPPARRLAVRTEPGDDLVVFEGRKRFGGFGHEYSLADGSSADEERIRPRGPGAIGDPAD